MPDLPESDQNEFLASLKETETDIVDVMREVNRKLEQLSNNEDITTMLSEADSALREVGQGLREMAPALQEAGSALREIMPALQAAAADMGTATAAIKELVGAYFASPNIEQDIKQIVESLQEIKTILEESNDSMDNFLISMLGSIIGGFSLKFLEKIPNIARKVARKIPDIIARVPRALPGAGAAAAGAGLGAGAAAAGAGSGAGAAWGGVALGPAFGVAALLALIAWLIASKWDDNETPVRNGEMAAGVEAYTAGAGTSFTPIFDSIDELLGSIGEMLTSLGESQYAQHMATNEPYIFDSPNSPSLETTPTPLLTGPLELFGKMWHSLLETVSQGAQYMNILHEPARPDGWGAGLLTSYIPAIACSMGNSTQFAINGDIVIYSQATDAKGIARDIDSEIRAIANHFNWGVAL
jgi:hypothetical protein